MSDNIPDWTRVEVNRWYRHFYAWSRALVSADDTNVRHIFDALAEDFRIVLTDGRLMDRADYGNRLTGLYGTRRGSPASEVANLMVLTISDQYALVVFDLMKPGMPGKKVDTALLRRDPRAPAGVSWVHVHESEHGPEGE